MKNVLKGLGIIILAFYLIFGLVPSAYTFVRSKTAESTTPAHREGQGGIIFDDSEFKDVASDIEGWTQLDKINAGLNYKNGSDSDHDGLTDKEEIEVYNSDPLKSSTAGDLYTDSYKVENGMDVSTYYEYEGTPEYKNNECSEVTPHATTPDSFQATIKALDIPSVKGYDVYKNYSVHFLDGTLSIDISDILSSNDIKADKLKVFVSNMVSGYEEVNYSLDGNTLTIERDFEYHENRQVVLATKTSIFAPKNPSFDITLNGSSRANIVANADYLFVHYLPILNVFTPGRKPHMYYVSTGNAEQDHEIEMYLIDLADDALDGRAGLLADGDPKKVNKIQMTALKTFVQPLLNLCSFKSISELSLDSAKPGHLFCLINDSYVDDIAYKHAEVSSITQSSNVNFSTQKDALPFENFKTTYSDGGNCAGIAYFTAKLFNDKSFASSGEYASDKYSDGSTSLSWNLSLDEDNNTLLDPVLSDYKGQEFVANHTKDSVLLNGLSTGEDEFTKMIAAYWAKTNEKIGRQAYMHDLDSDYGEMSWEMIEEMKLYLSQGKILVIGLMDTDGYGHAVNIVGYNEVRTGQSHTVSFILYDNEYPRDYRGYNQLVSPTLVVTKRACSEGYKESFSFEYIPYADCQYKYSSSEGSTGKSLFVVMDSDFNVLNDKY
nr:hypothetical protein [uncultured Butyrivibrio sp.]